MEKDIQEVMLTEAQIQARIEELGKILTEEYRDKNPVVLGVLKGVVIFYADMTVRSMCPAKWILCGYLPMRERIPPARWWSSGTSPRTLRIAMC